MSFTFTVLPVGNRPTSSDRAQAFLVTDNWDDWFTFATMYQLLVFDESGKRHEIGDVKIGQYGMKGEQRRPELPEVFEELDDRFFSLGQDDSYYERLNNLGIEIRELVLTGLRDLAAGAPELFQKAREERVTRVSLLRSVTPTSVEGQFRRLAHGGARLSRYSFSYKAAPRVGVKLPPIQVSFEVTPESYPPTNIHVLIGRNGVGKTYLLNRMARALFEEEGSSKQFGSFSFEMDEQPSQFASRPESYRPFANLVSVTFSAFDPFDSPPEQKDRSTGIHYSYIGLKRSSSVGADIGTPKTPDMLAREFVKSLHACLQGARLARWRRAMEMLEADPIFQEAEVGILASEDVVSELDKEASSLFNKLSSGHKIVLLTITRLVETAEERTLVLIDEPEAHLHPPLLSAFVRSLSDLLINRNGVAIIATHSPVVVQEVPKSCVWKLRRTGFEAIAERPETETFGENVGVLTREIFGLEVTQSGYHRLLRDVIEKRRTFESVVENFNGQLGAEARALVRALTANPDDDQKS